MEIFTSTETIVYNIFSIITSLIEELLRKTKLFFISCMNPDKFTFFHTSIH